jgi:hypothetical protein
MLTNITLEQPLVVIIAIFSVVFVTQKMGPAGKWIGESLAGLLVSSPAR